MKRKFFRQSIYTLLIIFVSSFLFAQTLGSGRYTKIKTSGIIKVGYTQNYPPLNFIHKNKRVGLETKLIKHLADFLQVKVKLVPISITEFTTFLNDGTIDIAIAGISRSLARAKKIWFSKPYLKITPSALVDKRVLPQTQFGPEFEDAPIKNIWDLNRLPDFSFGVKRGSVYENLITELFPSKKITTYKNNKLGLTALKGGKIDAYIQDSILLSYLYEKHADWKSHFKFLSGGHRKEEICVALPFGAYILKEQVNIFISELIRQRKIDKWLAQAFKQK